MSSDSPGTLDRFDAALIASARAGDQDAFRRLIEPHYRELHVHCYRMLGSLHEAEDLLQETLLRAWRRLDTFAGRASFRAWLHRIATNACLDALDRRPRRLLPMAYRPAADPTQPPSPPITEAIWIEPYPDALLDELHDTKAGPEARYDQREAIQLAFLAAIQCLPPRQRAVLILRDVLGFSAAEVATLLESTVASVNSALQRARATIGDGLPTPRLDSAPADGREKALLDRYVRAWEEADVGALVALLKEEATLSMPPFAEWYRGRESIAAFLSSAVFDRRGSLRLQATGANRQPAFALYELDAVNGAYRALAIQVLTLGRGGIADITGFVDSALFAPFGLPATLPA